MGSVSKVEQEPKLEGRQFTMIFVANWAINIRNFLVKKILLFFRQNAITRNYYQYEQTKNKEKC
jgi:hypothetical protein